MQIKIKDIRRECIICLMIFKILSCLNSLKSNFSYEYIHPATVSQNLIPSCLVRLPIHHHISCWIMMAPQADPWVLCHPIHSIPNRSIWHAPDRACNHWNWSVGIELVSIVANDLIFADNQPMVKGYRLKEKLR